MLTTSLKVRMGMEHTRVSSLAKGMGNNVAAEFHFVTSQMSCSCRGKYQEARHNSESLVGFQSVHVAIWTEYQLTESHCDVHVHA